MKKLPRKFKLILLFAFAWGIAANFSLLKAIDWRPATRGQPEKKFVVKPGGLLSFDADLGHGEVVTGDYESVRVEFKSYFKVETAEEVEALYDKLSIEMLQTDNTVKVTVKFADGNHTNRAKVRLDFRVHVPRKFNLDLRTGGSAVVGDVDGTVNASTFGGSLKLGNVSGSVTAKSHGGSLTIGNVGADLEARCEGGSSTIGHVNGRVVATTEGGSVSIEEATEAIDATATGGSVKVHLSKSPRSNCKITANAGDIDLRLAESVAVTIDAACTAGGITSEFVIAAKARTKPTQLKGDINGGGPVLVLRTTAGSVHIRK
ncbi:MAG: DUF4097 domain-containing protein [Chthoniobacterales bacterium]